MPGTEQQIRDIFSRADPARRATVPPPRITAALLIAHAEAVTTDTRRAALPKAGPARRRLLLTAAAMAAVGLAASVLGPLSTDHRHTAGQADPAGAAPAGSVVVPMAFQTDADPPPAADRLRALAANITNAPYDTQTGRYAHRRLKSWSDTQLSHDKLTVGYVEEYDEWTAPDGSGRSHRRIVGTEFPDQASRLYWEPRLARDGYLGVTGDDLQEIPAGPRGDPLGPPHPADQTQPPTDPAQLAKVLRAEYGPADATKWTTELYRSYVVPRKVRAEVLRILAGLPGFVWRGQVTDRAGRPGMAISVRTRPDPNVNDPNLYEYVLVFDEHTGVLLASESAIVEPTHTLTSYDLILGADRTDKLG